MVGSTPDELHEFAQSIGMQRRWFQNHRKPHYDCLGFRMHKKAIDAGAKLVTSKEIVEFLKNLE